MSEKPGVAPPSADGATETVFVGLGANLGDALGTLTAAVFALDELDRVQVVDASGVYRTPPWPPADDPRAVPQDDYLNMVVRLETVREPDDLHEELQLIERAFGRDRATEQRWGPRRLDLDILLFGERVIDTASLTVPHPRMHERAFVLVPLMEVFPSGVMPDGRRLTQLVMALTDAEEITLEVRLDELPGPRVRRPDGPAGGVASFTRPDVDDIAGAHGAGR